MTLYINNHAPEGATHYGHYATGKLFYALEFYNQSKTSVDYLIWFPVQHRFYSVNNFKDKLTPLKRNKK